MLTRSLLGLEGMGDDASASTAANGAIQSDLVVPSDAPILYDLLDLPQPPDLRLLYEAMDSHTRNERRQETLVRLVERASHRQPRALVVEDVHWAEPMTLSDLAMLSSAVSHVPAILIMTSRTEGDPIDAEWAIQSWKRVANDH